MKIIAKTFVGKEFMYVRKTARKVSEKSADRILKELNAHKAELGLKEDEIFHIYEIDKYDATYEIAQKQAYIIKNGYLYAKDYR